MRWFLLAACSLTVSLISQTVAGQLTAQVGGLWQNQKAAAERQQVAPVVNTSLSDSFDYYAYPSLLDHDHTAVRPLPITHGFSGQGSSWYSPPSNPEFFRTFHHQPFLSSSAFERSSGQTCSCGDCSRCQDIWRGICREGQCCGDFGVSALDWIRKRNPRLR